MAYHYKLLLSKKDVSATRIAVTAAISNIRTVLGEDEVALAAPGSCVGRLVSVEAALVDILLGSHNHRVEEIGR